MNIARFIKKRKNKYLWQKNETKKLASFYNKHKGEDCFIIGNGPSLNKMNLEPLSDYYLFGLNKIFLIFERVNLNLSYLVSVNKHVIEQSNQQFKDLDCPIFLDYENAYGQFQNTQHVNYIIGNGPRGFQNDITKPLDQGATVTYVAMQIAYYMGFKNIFLIGVDHSFKQKGKPNELQNMSNDDVNHFDPNYFKGQNWQLADLDESERSYLYAKEYIESQNRNIYDATVGGKLEIFKKIPFEQALEMAKKKHK